MRKRDLDALDFGGVCDRVADFATSDAGKARCRNLLPSESRAMAELALKQTGDFARLLESHGRPPLDSFPDVRQHLHQAALDGFVLGGETLVEVRSVLECLGRCAAFFKRHRNEVGSLLELVGDLPSFPIVTETLLRALDHDGSVLDQASDELAAIRVEIRKLRETLSRRLHDLVGRRSMSDVVSDQYVTLRNDRFVIPVKAGSSSRVQGVVQDRSVSGETFFIEPLFAVELNNRLLGAVRDEQAIVRRILADLTDMVGREAAGIQRGIEQLSEIDCTMARALFAAEYDCTLPSFSEGAISLRMARHPGLSFTGRPVVPVDILLPRDKRVLVITGPNTGGKTVGLKTLGLCALMAQSGMLIPAADGATLPFFTGVFTDVGDDQNIERDLSTFSAHVVNLREILSASNELSLILLDEPGVGTDPEEGAALAVGLLHYFTGRTARVAVTTHYRAVKVHAVSSDACHVAAVGFDTQALEPHYQLTYNSLGRSLALPIAERLGLDAEVLDAARDAQSEDTRSFSDALERLEASRKQLENEREGLRQQLDALDAQRAAVDARDAEAARLVDELRERKKRAWKDELREAREFVHELKDKGKAQLAEIKGRPAERAEFAAFVRAQEERISEHAKTLSPPSTATALAPHPSMTPSQPKIGDIVEVGSHGIQGDLLSVDGERAWIQRGTLRFEVPTAKLRKVRNKVVAPPQIRIDRTLDKVEREISLVGLRARQALEKLEGFLDKATQTDQDTVRIIHGIGSGALQRAVRDYLSSSPYCSGYRAGEEGEGGAGVTVAMLGE